MWLTTAVRDEDVVKPLGFAELFAREAVWDGHQPCTGCTGAFKVCFHLWGQAHKEGLEDRLFAVAVLFLAGGAGCQTMIWWCWVLMGLHKRALAR